MFGIKEKDRHVIEVVIKFNITAINEWLENGGKLKQIEKIKRASNLEDKIQSYHIDVLPNGKESDMYFHRKTGLFSENIAGSDLLNDDVEHATAGKIEVLSWNLSHASLVLAVNRELILIAPTTEIVELQTRGELKDWNWADILGKEKGIKKIPVPLSFDKDGKPEKSMGIYRTSYDRRAVEYSNVLGSISAYVSRGEVLY